MTPEGREHAQLLSRGQRRHTSRSCSTRTSCWATRPYVEVGVRSVSPDGHCLAYSVDVDGDEVYELRFRDLHDRDDLPDTVPHTYYGGAWSADG